MRTAIAILWASVGLALGADSSLKLWYRFDGDTSGGVVIDDSGNGHTGYRMNPTNWITQTNGVTGLAAKFTTNGVLTDGQSGVYTSSQYIAVTNVAGIEWLTNATFAFWGQWDGKEFQTNRMDVMANGSDPQFVVGASNNWNIGRSNGRKMAFYSYINGLGDYHVVECPVEPDVGQGGRTTNWHHYAFTVALRLSTNNVVAYFDGAPVATNTLNFTHLHIYGCATYRWMAIGANTHNGLPGLGVGVGYPNDAWVAGRLDDVRIYNRDLALSEIQSLTNWTPNTSTVRGAALSGAVVLR